MPQAYRSPPATEDLVDEGVDEPTLAEVVFRLFKQFRQHDRAIGIADNLKSLTFDGSDPNSLDDFLRHLDSHFSSNPIYFGDDAKIIFAYSHLRGTALEFFEPSLQVVHGVPDWLEDWNIFTQILRFEFGRPDHSVVFHSDIVDLTMQADQRIHWYNFNFNRLAEQTGWSNRPLRYCYYSGLAERIRIAIDQDPQGLPVTLRGMKALANRIDARYWRSLRLSYHSPPTNFPSFPSFSGNSDNSTEHLLSVPGLDPDVKLRRFLLDDILNSLVNVYVTAYPDDILLCSDDFEDQFTLLWEVFRRLKIYGARHFPEKIGTPAFTSRFRFQDLIGHPRA